MTPDREKAISDFVQQIGLQTTLVGIGIWCSEIIYGIVLCVLFIAAPQSSSEVHGQAADFLLILSVLLMGISLVPTPVAAIMLRSMLLKSKATVSDGAVNSTPAMKDLAERYPHLFMAYGQYFRASLVSSAIAESPGIYGLVLMLLLYEQGSPLGCPIVFALAVCMMVLALALKAFMIPTARRLERHLRQHCATVEEQQ